MENSVQKHFPKSKTTAEAILTYCKENDKKYFTTKYDAKHIINKETNLPYNAHEIGCGIRYLIRAKAITRISKNRYEIG